MSEPSSFDLEQTVRSSVAPDRDSGSGQLVPGRRIDRFELVQLLGQGGGGLAWKAIDPRRASAAKPGFVALKFVPAYMRSDTEACARFCREYQRVERLQHRNICPLYDLVDSQSLGPFQVMKFLEGQSLRQRINSSPAGLSIAEVLSIVRQTAAALDYAHQTGVIHRDVKPENIIQCSDLGDWQIIDFGIAAEIRSSLSNVSRNACSTSGTEAYMAPEQWQGRHQTGSCDLWALAIVAWELLTGYRPFSGHGTALGFAICSAQVPELPAHLSSLQPVFATALCKSPAARQSSVGEFAACLEQAAAVDCRQTPHPRRVTAPERLQVPFSPADIRAARRDWARHLGIPEFWTPRNAPAFVLIPPGGFLMGTTDNQHTLQACGINLPTGLDVEHEMPQQPAEITTPFYMSVSTVSVAEFSHFVSRAGFVSDAEQTAEGGWGIDPATGRSLRSRKFDWKSPGYRQQPDYPVVNVSWQDAVAFARWLTTRLQPPAGFSELRLASEAEWEYSCRAGTATRYRGGLNRDCVPQPPNSGPPLLSSLFGQRRVDLPVARMSAHEPPEYQNGFGLHRMQGHAWQWCQDLFDKRNATSAKSGERVLRGGSWALESKQLRCSIRIGRNPREFSHRIGFRIVCSLSAIQSFSTTFCYTGSEP